MTLLESVISTQINIGINAVATLILIYTVISFLLEVKKTKATFYLDKVYLKRLCIGFLFFLINSFIGFSIDLINYTGNDDEFQWVFVVLIILALILTGVYFSILKIKNANVKAAEVEGISEREYWERLSNAVSTNLENQALINEGS